MSIVRDIIFYEPTDETASLKLILRKRRREETSFILESLDLDDMDTFDFALSKNHDYENKPA